MDPELKEAACSGNVDFLRSAVGLKPIKYLLKKLSPMDENIFHLATRCKQSGFLKVATEILPVQVQQELLSQKDKNGCTPLHTAAGLKQSRQISLEMVKLILGFYKSGVPVIDKPWLEHNQNGYTPLHLAIEVVNEESAMEILSMDMESLCMMVDKKENDSPLFLAVKNGCNKVAEKILLSSYSYSLRGKDVSTPLHFAPNSSENVLRLLLEKHPDLIDAVDHSNGYNMLHQWAELNQVWPIDFLLRGEFPAARTKVFTDLITMKAAEENLYDTPLHTAARTHKNVEITKSIINGYKLEQEMKAGNMDESTDYFPPWRIGNIYKHTPLLVAIYEQQNEELALYYINLDWTLCHMFSDSAESPLFAAVGDCCENVVEEILNNQEVTFNMLRKTKGNTILHSLWKMPENTGTKLFERYWWMIKMRDSEGKAAGETALEVAKKKHQQWLISLIQNYQQSKNLEPFDWLKACEKEETSWAVLAFIDSCPNLRKICLEENDTPLHHIKLQNYQDCVDLLNLPFVAELKNTRDSNGATPLHRALERNDIYLATALLRDEGVERNIKDPEGNTAMSLLAELCEDRDWEYMCYDLNINPHLRLSFIHYDMKLDPIRSALFIVAALLATITFAAGFTLPGGVDEEDNMANKATKPSFIVFLLADAYALCSSMLVLFGLIWSMASNRAMEYLLVDRSIFILITSLYGTMLAFMTGIYTVLPNKSLWVAIIVFIICSLPVIFAIRTLLDYVLSKLVPAAANHFQANRIRYLDSQADQVRTLEEGKTSLSRMYSTIPPQYTTSLAEQNSNNAENRELVPLLKEGQASTSRKDDAMNPPSSQPTNSAKKDKGKSI